MWLAQLLGSHPHRFSEGRYWANGGVVPADRWFIRLEVALSLIFTLLAASSASTVPVEYFLIRGARIALAVWLMFLLHGRFGVRTHRLYLWWAVIANLESVGFAAHATQAGYGNIGDISTVFLLNFASTMIIHPLHWPGKLAAVLMGLGGWFYWLAIQIIRGLPVEWASTYLVTSVSMVCIVILSSVFERQRRQSFQRWEQARRQLIDRNRVRRNLLDELRQSYDNLAEAAQWRQDALATNMARTLVHEMAQPISAASNQAYVLSRELPADKVQSLVQDLSDARQALADFKQFFIDQNSSPVQGSLTACVQEVMVFLSRRFPISYSDLDQLPDVAVRVRRQLLAQVLVNLVRNAVHANQGQATQIEFVVDIQDKSVALNLSNDGPPIPSDRIPHLFDLNPDSQTDGFGVGLALGRTTLRAAGGDLSLVSSDPVCFQVQLPRALDHLIDSGME